MTRTQVTVKCDSDEAPLAAAGQTKENACHPREVIPSREAAKAINLMMDGPTPSSDKQLKEVGIAVVEKKDI